MGFKESVKKMGEHIDDDDGPTPQFMKIVIGIMIAFLVSFGLLSYVIVFGLPGL